MDGALADARIDQALSVSETIARVASTRVRFLKELDTLLTAIHWILVVVPFLFGIITQSLDTGVEIPNDIQIPEPSPSNDADHQPTAAPAILPTSQSIKVYGTGWPTAVHFMLVASSTVYGTFCTVHQVIVQSVMVRLLEGANTLLTKRAAVLCTRDEKTAGELDHALRLLSNLVNERSYPWQLGSTSDDVRSKRGRVLLAMAWPPYLCSRANAEAVFDIPLRKTCIALAWRWCRNCVLRNAIDHPLDAGETPNHSF